MPAGTPTYLTIDAQGRVGANFTGHVHAQGLDLDAALSNTPPDVDKIRWIKQSDGSVIADIKAYNVGTQNVVALEAIGGNTSEAVVQAIDMSNSQAAFIAVTDSGHIPYTQAYVNDPTTGFNKTVTILDGNGNSDFIQSAQGFGNLSIKYGSFLAALPVGWSTWNPTPNWTHNHFSLYASVNPAFGYTIGGIESGPTGFGSVNPSKGFINIQSNTAQTVSVYWFSLGN